jgi:hypothetical protein
VVAAVVRKFAVPQQLRCREKRWEYGDGKEVWQGTASELQIDLREFGGELMSSKAWPNTPGQLSGRLRRVAPLLRQVGIEVDFVRVGRERDRIIRITTTTTPPIQLVATGAA